MYDVVAARNLERLSRVGISPDEVRMARSADMRLVGQIHEIEVPVPGGELGPATIERMESDFESIYRELYGWKDLNIPIEIQNWRLAVRGPAPSVNLRRQAVVEGASATEAKKQSRPAYFDDATGYVDCPVYDRYRLSAGTRIIGPAIVEERESTAVIGPRDAGYIDEWLNLIIDVG
jgi:N-methylhydantoinase A/oxoprolinase/acetone carboxylase beta subunit